MVTPEVRPEHRSSANTSCCTRAPGSGETVIGKKFRTAPGGKALDFASHAAAITVTRMGAMPSLPTITEVQELLRERGYEDFDLSLLDVLH